MDGMNKKTSRPAPLHLLFYRDALSCPEQLLDEFCRGNFSWVRQLALYGSSRSVMRLQFLAVMLTRTSFSNASGGITPPASHKTATIW